MACPSKIFQRHAVRLARLILQAMPGGHRDFVHREEHDCSDSAAAFPQIAFTSPRIFASSASFCTEQACTRRG